MGYTAEAAATRHAHRRPSSLPGTKTSSAARICLTQTTATAAARRRRRRRGSPAAAAPPPKTTRTLWRRSGPRTPLTLRGAIPSVLNVTRSLRPPYGSPSAQSYADEMLGEDFRSNRCRLLNDLISEAIGEGKDWPVESVIGDPATRILEAAATENAELIVIGINHHGLSSRRSDRTRRRVSWAGQCAGSRRTATECEHGKS